jgi:hypothetical protein
MQALLPQCAAHIAYPTAHPVDCRPLRDRHGKSQVSNMQIEHIEARPQATGEDARYSQLANTRSSQLKYNPETHPLAPGEKELQRYIRLSTKQKCGSVWKEARSHFATLSRL